MTLPSARPVIAAMPRYVPGARGADHEVPPIKVSSNETPLGPLPSVTRAIVDAAASANRYPDMFAIELTERIAHSVGVNPDQVAVGGGSVGVLAHVLQAFCERGDEVLFAWRSFEAYPILTHVVGAAPITVPLTADARHDLPAMAQAVTARTKVILLCTPNNPTGPSIGHDEFEAFMAAIPTSVLVVLDEAYVEFVTDPGTIEGLLALGRHPNLLLLRTFSKAYGLAGLRVGYAVGSAELITPVRACVTPFSVSSVAQAAALASLDAKEELLDRVGEVVSERERVVGALAADGWAMPAAQGNFYWIGAGARTASLAVHFAEAVPPILVRPFAGEGLRITVGSAQENDAVLAALATFPDRVTD